MKAKSRLFRVVLAAGLVISLLAAVIAPVAAQPNPPSGDPPFVFQDPPKAFAGGGVNSIYYPWVANGEDFGLGESQTSISVQNLENRDGQVWIYRGNGNNGWVYAATAQLNAWAAKTFTAAQLGITDGAPVAVVGFAAEEVIGDAIPWTGTPPASNATYTETVVILSNPLGPGEGQEQALACVANNAAGNPSPFLWALPGAPDLGTSGATYVMGSDGSYWVTWTNQTQLQDILDHVNDGNPGPLINPFGGLNEDGDCNDALAYDATGVQYWDSLTIGGTAFATATADSGAALEQISTTHTATSGYNSLNGLEVDTFNDWYLPIVQTNGTPGGAWNSIIRVANLAANNSAVEVRFFPADDGSGSLQTGFQLQALVQGGETWNINLSDYVPEGWVGAAHIYSDGAVFAMVDRYKVGYNMWITNTGSAADFENEAQFGDGNELASNYVLFAPHVLVDYFGWNTGINVANLVEEDNNVSIQYFNMLGNATQGLSQRLAPHGMTYFYDPSESGQNWSSQDPATDPNAGIVASALIWSDHPVAAVVDATKYPDTDPRGGADVFQATSYSATQNAYGWQAVPYVTKGNATDGSGATSGINFMNPNAIAAVVDVYWVNPSGFKADNFGTSVVTIPAYANGFVYSLWQHNLPNGFTGAAVAISRGGTPIVAASANVNYDVEGDGAVIYNGFNPCGFYRTISDERRVASQLTPDTFGFCEESEIDPPTGTIQVIVTTDSTTDATVDDRTVQLFDGPCETIGQIAQDFDETNANGVVSFDDLEPGVYCVVLSQIPGDLSVLPADRMSVALMPDGSASVTFTLTAAVQRIVVRAEDLHPGPRGDAEGTDQWFFYNDSSQTGASDGPEGIDNTLGSFVVGPGTAPEGTGSAEIELTNADQRRNLATYQFSGVALDDIEVLTFSAYGTYAYLNFNVDFYGTDVWQNRLVYVPARNGAPVAGTWQEWDAINDGDAVWTWSGYGRNVFGTPVGQWPGGETEEYLTWDEILEMFPDIRIRVTDSWLGIRVGDPGPAGAVENIDNFRWQVAGGPLMIFDFEPTLPD